MTDDARPPAERCVELLDARELSCRELAAAYLDRIERPTAAVHAFLRTRREAALAEADRLRPRRPHGPAGRADRAQGHPLHARRGDDGAARASSRATCRSTTAAASRAVKAARARHRSARRTWTSSRWAPRPRTPRSASPTTRGTPTASRAARRGGSAAAVAAGVRAALARHRHRRLDPPAGRALRRGRPEADLRRASAATGWSRSPPRSTRSARSRARCATARCSMQVICGKDALRLDLGRRCPSRSSVPTAERPARACASACPRDLLGAGRRAGRAGGVRGAAARGRGAGRQGRRDRRCRTRGTRCRPTT